MNKLSVQIETLEAKQGQLGNRLQALRSRQARIDHAMETKRLVMAGRWLFKICGQDRQKVGSKLEGAGLLAPQHRRLFDLPEVDEHLEQ